MRPTKVVLLAVVGFAVFSVAMFVAFLLLLDGGPEVDCSTVSDPAPGAWQAGDFDIRNRIVVDLSRCERLQGRSRAEVERLLGPPSEVVAGEVRYELPTDGAGPANTWVLYLDGAGRVTDTRYQVFSGF